MEKEQLNEWIGRYLAGGLSPEEKALVERELLEEYYTRMEAAGTAELSVEETTELKETMFRHILERIREDGPGRVIPMIPAKDRGRRWRVRIGAAAAVVLLLGVTYIYTNRSGPKPAVSVVQAPVTHDVPAPATNRATITLAGGQTVFLDSVASGAIATQGTVRIAKLQDGQLRYTGASGQEDHLIYNTLTNPRGSRVIGITLTDGSRVWLNAGSCLKYPVLFATAERKVSVTGEAYFEVKRDPGHPFIVEKGDLETRVLGTHFNVNAYEDEPDIKVTLLEGSVEVDRGGNRELLRPGEQAIAGSAGKIGLNKHADLEQTMAWKNGLFNFSSSDIRAVMRELARWYDIDVQFEGKTTTDTFGGGMTRTASLAQVLEILQTSKVHFRLEGRKLTVLP